VVHWCQHIPTVAFHTDIYSEPNVSIAKALTNIRSVGIAEALTNKDVRTSRKLADNGAAFHIANPATDAAQNDVI
jgi:hypothetical protein